MAVSGDNWILTMTTDRWHQIESVFHSALELESDDRSGFLERVCQGDPELRREVEDLLVALDTAGDFIEASPLAGVLVGFTGESGHQKNSGSSETELPPGARIGRYEIQSLLGFGGMGQVYLARDVDLGRQVAIKILPRQFGGDVGQVHRFEREARAASVLNHPNIITVYEVGREQDMHFIATEFVAGATLRQKIEEKRATVEDAIRIAIQITAALAAAHEAHIVHRDIKPENIMVRPDGLVKVLDFGLAKPGVCQSSGSMAPVSMQTDPGTFMGTTAYLSPEQVRREEVDHRSDLFSLGVVLYELVAGRRPFGGSQTATVFDSILNAPPPVESINIPDSLKGVISRALQKDRNARYQSAFEMRNDLMGIVAETGSGRLGSIRRFARPIALFPLAALMLVIAALLLARREAAVPTGSFSTGPVIRITDMPGQEIFPSISSEGTVLVFASKATGSWDIYLKRMGEAGVVNLTPERRYVDLAPSLSPDGKTIAFRSSRDGEGIFLMDTEGRNIRRITGEGHNPTWSPDGQEIAVATDRVFDFEGRIATFSSLYAVNVQTGARRVIAATDAVQPSWSPHGHRIAYWGVRNGGQRDIWTVSAIGGDPISVTNDSAADWNPVWSPNGKYLYFLSSRGGNMNLWRAPIDEASGKVTGSVEAATLPSINSQHVSFSPDGSAMVYVEMNRRENSFEAAFDPIAGAISGPAIQLTKGVRRHCNPEISPDETRLSFSSQGEAQEDIFTTVLESNQILQLTNDAALDRLPRWSPDGRRIAFVSDRSGKQEIWAVSDDGEDLEQQSYVNGSDVTNPVWSPDGKRLLYQVVGVNAFTIEPETPRGERAPHALAGRQVPWFLPWSWSPDGRQLAGWQLTPGRPDMNLVTYSFATGTYQVIPLRGQYPVWMNDSRSLIFTNLGDLYLLDTVTRKTRLLQSIEPDNFGTFSLSRDNRRLYYSRLSAEADIWMVSLK